MQKLKEIRNRIFEITDQLFKKNKIRCRILSGLMHDCIGIRHQKQGLKLKTEICFLYHSLYLYCAFCALSKNI
jgi:hypothetical protein